MAEQFLFSTNPITDLALPLPLEHALTAALDVTVDVDSRHAVASEIEDAVNARLAESGWDGPWSAADIVRRTLNDNGFADEA